MCVLITFLGSDPQCFQGKREPGRQLATVQRTKDALGKMKPHDLAERCNRKKGWAEKKEKQKEKPRPQKLQEQMGTIPRDNKFTR